MTNHKLQTKVALVTGAAGFLGRNVARAAAADGYRVIGAGHHPPRANFEHASEWHEGDIALPLLQRCSEKPDIIFHCAGGASVAQSLSEPLKDFERTVQSTAAVLEYARSTNRAAAVVIPSSAAVYGISENQPLAVRSRPNPFSPYGVHKKLTEDLARSYASHFGTRVSIVRLFSIYGRGLRKQLLWDACTRLSAGIGDFGGTGAETRDWLHVDDAAALMLYGASNASPMCPIVNGGSGDPVAIGEIVRSLKANLNSNAEISFSGITRPGDPPHYVADISDALAWGWTPKCDLRIGLLDYTTWFKAQSYCDA